MSGPSATAKPMSAKIAVSSSVTWLIGCTRPISAGASRTGRVTSTASLLRRTSSVASASPALRAAIAAVTRSLRPLMSGPCCLRSSGVMAPSVFNSADTVPLLPSAATRIASSAGSSGAAAMAGRSSASSVAMSVMFSSLAAPTQHPGFDRVHERAPFLLGGDPFVLHAHPPARLGVGVVDQHQPRTVHKPLALLDHDIAILAEKDVHERLDQRRQQPHPGR